MPTHQRGAPAAAICARDISVLPPRSGQIKMAYSCHVSRCQMENYLSLCASDMIHDGQFDVAVVSPGEWSGDGDHERRQ